MTAGTTTVSALTWRERFEEVAADRDYWRGRAESWEARYVEASAQVARLAEQVVTLPTAGPETGLPEAVDQAIQRAVVGQPKDVARRVRREVATAYYQASGTPDERARIALRRLAEGDAPRLRAFLGEGE